MFVSASSSSSSSSGCRAVDHKFPLLMAVLSHFQQLIVIWQAIRIPRKTMNIIIGEQGLLSTGFPPPMSRNIHCKFSDRLLFRQSGQMTKETQLPKPDSFNKGSCWYASNLKLRLISSLYRVFIRHRRSENSPLTKQNSPANVR